MYISVVINISSSNVDLDYEYFVDDELKDLIKVGARVKVPFGNGDKTVMGFIIDIHPIKQYSYETKEIIELVDLEPFITEEQIKLAKMIRDDCICPLIRILYLMIPDALKMKNNCFITVSNIQNLDARLINLFGDQETIEYNKSLKQYSSLISKEIKKGNLILSYDTISNTNIKYINTFIINHFLCDGIKNNELNDKQIKFLNDYSQSEPLEKKDIVTKFDITLYSLNKLIEKGYLLLKKERKLRISNKSLDYSKTYNIDDNSKEISNKILNYQKPVLYMPCDNVEEISVLLSLITKTIDKEKNVVIICPTILQSFSICSLIEKNLNINCACINSTLSEGEYLDIFTEVLNDAYRVIVTTTKGILLPYQNVGLYYLVDEESDNYYNDQSPRYDAKKIIEHLSSVQSATYVMESFCPSVTNYLYALKGIYEIVNNLPSESDFVPDCVNTIEELKVGNNTFISRKLQSEIINTYNDHSISLLLINNFNYSTQVMCSKCGNIEVCPKCGLGLQYNEKHQKLICPACGYQHVYESKCSKCGGDVDFYGVGMEFVKEKLTQMFPFLKIAVISAPKFKDLQKVLNDISDDEVDVILTSNAYASSLYLDKVKLVSIINLDATLNAPAYDANSRAYGMMSKARRFVENNNGKLIIQTKDLENDILRTFIIGNYNDFIKLEIKNRKLTYSEPFYHVNRIIVKANFDSMFVIANTIKRALQQILANKVFIIGPTYSKLEKGAVLIIKHSYENISSIYKKIYEQYQKENVIVIFDKYPRKL